MSIDFVIPWVDDTDEKWLAEKNKYIGQYFQTDEITGDCRYRDWDILKYWFRSVEKYAPWVRKIHFVTCGHLPKFLNEAHPKLNIVKHSDYMPKEYLPTFSSHAIEMNFHKIEDLSEQFVYFNDDMFINAPVKEEDFFKNGKPCTQLMERAIIPSSGFWMHTILSDMGLINKYFSKRALIKKHPFKYLNPKYGKRNLYNLITILNLQYQEIENMHLPNPILKSTIETVWKEEYEALDRTSRNKFKTIGDVNQYVFSYWDIASGNFHPTRIIGKAYQLNKRNQNECVNDIIYGKNKLICINDNQRLTDFEMIKKRVVDAFEERYPNKSEFEK